MTSKTCEYGCASTNSCGKCTGCKGNPDCDVAAKSCTYGCASTNSCGVCTSCKTNPDCDVSSLSCTYGCKTTNSCSKCTACKSNPDCDVTSKSCTYGCASTNSCGKCTACKSQGSCSDYGYSSTIKTPILLWTCDKVTINGLTCYDCYGNTSTSCPGGKPYSPCNCGGTHGGPGYAASHFC